MTFDVGLNISEVASELTTTEWVGTMEHWNKY